MDSPRVKFYFVLGSIAALLLNFSIVFGDQSSQFLAAGFIYFLSGLFLGWRIESKNILAFVLIFIPLAILFTAYYLFADGAMIIIHIFIISMILFFDGFLISKFWKHGLIKLAVVMITIGAGGYMYSLF